MSIRDYFNRIFSAGKDHGNTYAAWMSDAQPVFTAFGNDIYMSDYVNNAIDKIATEISKISVRSVVERKGGTVLQNDDITRLFRHKPNPLQTTSDFLSSVEWLRRKNRNAFIYPQYETVSVGSRTFRRYTAFWPLNPTGLYIGVNDGNVWEIKMEFQDGTSYPLPYADLVHMKWRRGKNLIIGGGDDYGQENDIDVLRTVQALDKTIQGIPKSIEASLQIKGLYNVKSLKDMETLKAERDTFESHVLTSKAGVAAIDLAGEFTPINIKPADIPEEAMKFLKAVIQERYGISAAIMSGDYNGEQHSAFYQTAIEDFIVQFEQAFSPCVFTDRELDVGRRIKCYYSKVNYLATKDKMELAGLAKETGIMSLNQINEMFGIEPFAAGDRRLQSLNYVNLDDVDAYQKSKANGTGGKGNAEE